MGSLGVRAVGGFTSPLIRCPTISELPLPAMSSASGRVRTAGAASSHLENETDNLIFK